MTVSLIACGGSKKKADEPATVVVMTTTDEAPVAEPAPATPVVVSAELRSACQMSTNEIENTDLHFDFDETALEPEHNQELEAVAGCLTDGRLGASRIAVIGYADAVGTEQVNDHVAEERAESVAEYLFRRGVAEDRVVIESKGEDLARLPAGASEEARAIDRRVELVVMR